MIADCFLYGMDSRMMVSVAWEGVKTARASWVPVPIAVTSRSRDKRSLRAVTIVLRSRRATLKATARADFLARGLETGLSVSLRFVLGWTGFSRATSARVLLGT